MSRFSYCIITPAHNEAAYIENTIKSVLRQTILPQIWIIVDDGSTDSTVEIVKKYAVEYKYIKCLHREKPEGQAYYASNVHAIMEGWHSLQEESFDYLAILDADITLQNDYYEQILQSFEADTKLGVASGIYENLIDGKLCKVLHDRRSTPKAIQVFRREVFKQIGGFLPLQYGGEDTIACVKARMAGWKAWSFPDIKVVHHRPTGTGKNSNIFRVRFNQGVCEYSLASHPLFFILKAVRRIFLEKPFFFGGMLRLCGYFWALLNQNEILIPADVARHIRQEQLGRLFKLNKINLL
jgi:poly-beta-1,6-N-acetyl-D-glucosamine synthase